MEDSEVINSREPYLCKIVNILDAIIVDLKAETSSRSTSRGNTIEDILAACCEKTDSILESSTDCDKSEAEANAEECHLKQESKIDHSQITGVKKSEPKCQYLDGEKPTEQNYCQLETTSKSQDEKTSDCQENQENVLNKEITDKDVILKLEVQEEVNKMNGHVQSNSSTDFELMATSEDENDDDENHLETSKLLIEAHSKVLNQSDNFQPEDSDKISRKPLSPSNSVLTIQFEEEINMSSHDLGEVNPDSLKSQPKTDFKSPNLESFNEISSGLENTKEFNRDQDTLLMKSDIAVCPPPETLLIIPEVKEETSSDVCFEEKSDLKMANKTNCFTAVDVKDHKVLSSPGIAENETIPCVDCDISPAKVEDQCVATCIPKSNFEEAPRSKIENAGSDPVKKEREIIAKSNPKKTEPSKLQEVAPRGQPEKSAKGKPATSGVKPSQRSQPVNGSARPSPAKSIPGTKPISKPLPGILKPNPTSKTQPGSLKTNPVSKPLQVSSKAFNVSSQKLTSTTGSEPNKKIPPTRPESPSKGRSTQVNKTDPKPSAPGVKASIPDKTKPEAKRPIVGTRTSPSSTRVASKLSTSSKPATSADSKMKAAESPKTTTSIAKNTTQPAKKLTIPIPAARKSSGMTSPAIGRAPNALTSAASPKPAPRTTTGKKSLVTSGPKPTDLTKKVVKKQDEELVDVNGDLLVPETIGN